HPTGLLPGPDIAACAKVLKIPRENPKLVSNIRSYLRSNPARMKGILFRISFADRRDSEFGTAPMECILPYQRARLNHYTTAAPRLLRYVGLFSIASALPTSVGAATTRVPTLAAAIDGPSTHRLPQVLSISSAS